MPLDLVGILVSSTQPTNSPSCHHNPGQIANRCECRLLSILQGFPPPKDVFRTTEDSILAVANQRLPLLLSLFSHGGQSPRNQSSFQTPVEYQVALGPARNAISYASVHLFDADICRWVYRPKLRFRRSPTIAFTAYGFPPLGLKPQEGRKRHSVF